VNLIQDCKQAIERDLLKDGKPRTTLVLKGKWTKSGKKKLFSADKTSPVGEIFAEPDDNKLLVSFDAKEVLKYMES
jgi:hypothetical protein